MSQFDVKELRVNPTLACGNSLNFKADLDILEKTGIRILHLDIMDGHYVPNICFSIDTVARIRSQYPFLLDVHLMVTNPEDYILPLQKAGADDVCFHLDATSFPIRLLNQIHECGMKGGVVLNPSQPVSLLGEVLPYLDMVLVMGVEPGFSGQKFLSTTFEKVEVLKKIRDKKGYPFLIQVDGGVDMQNSVPLIQHGADLLVSGAFGVFRGGQGLEKDCREYQELVRTL